MLERAEGTQILSKAVILNLLIKSLNMITEKHLSKLFDVMWPTMLHVHEHKQNCINQLSTLNRFFARNSKDHNQLLYDLMHLDGIKVTIASGLIWSVYPSRRVPFDKWTTTHALEYGLIKTNNVSDDYVNISNRINKFCKGYTINNRPFTITDFVRESRTIEKYKEYLVEPV